jgi:glycosyltransferase involved in cell wall biosynthesis
MVAKRFKIGDHVSWSSEAGHVSGTIVAVHTRDVDYKGHRHHASDQRYFDATIRPMLASPGVEMIGEISEREKPAFLSGAVGLLMPIEWPEPFGLVMIEAMSCGTPVIAFNRGSVPEVIEDGLTGFIVEDEAAAIAAVRCLDRLDRGAVRLRFEQRFTARRMAEDYLATYLAADERPVVRQPLRVIKSAAGGARSNSTSG